MPRLTKSPRSVSKTVETLKVFCWPVSAPECLRNAPRRPPSPVAGSNQASVSPRLPAVSGAGEGEVGAMKTLLGGGRSSG